MVGLHYLGGFRCEVDFFAGTLFCFDVCICSLLLKTQLNEHETDRYFLQNFQCMTLLIDAFCKIFEHEIVLQECKSKRKQFQVHNSYKICEQSNKLLYYFGKNEENMDQSLIHLSLPNNFEQI